MKWGTNRNYKSVPCKDCEKRGCGAYHSQCEVYKMWKEQNEKLRMERLQNREISDTIEELALHRMRSRIRKA